MISRDGPDDLMETVCGAALQAVRGHGGERARWMADVTRTALAILDEEGHARRGDARTHRAASGWW